MGGELDKRPGATTAVDQASGAAPASAPGRSTLTAGALPRTTADLAAGPVRVTADRLNVRETPALEPGNVLGGLEHGQVVTAVARDGDWIRIIFGGGAGYVSKTFVEPATQPDAGATAVSSTPGATPAMVDATAPAKPVTGGSVVLEPVTPPYKGVLPPQPAPSHPGSVFETAGTGEFATASGNMIAKTAPAEAAVLNHLRSEPRRFDPAWMVVAQQNLGVVDATGAMNTETLRAMRERAHRPKLDASQIMDEAFLSTLAPGTPFFAGTTLGFGGQAIDPTATSPADLAAQAAGYASYLDYKATWVPIKFLGVLLGPPLGHGSGRGHPYLAARLQVAEAFLRQRHPNPKGDAGVIKAIGWNGKGNAAYDDDAKLMLSHPHTMGLAVDFDPSHNVYLFNEHIPGLTHEQAMWWIQELEAMSKTATRIYGGEPIKPDVLLDWSHKTSTEELFQRVTATSEAFAKLFQLSHKPAEEILATLTGAGFSADEAAAELPAVQKADERFHQGGGRQDAGKLTNLHEELVLALRDAAGLSWGGTDMSMRENADFMHFDCRDTEFGHAVGAKKAPHKDK
jgi:hypothetical protein